MNSKSVLIIIALPFMCILWFIGWLLYISGQKIYDSTKDKTKELIKELKDDF